MGPPIQIVPHIQMSAHKLFKFYRQMSGRSVQNLGAYIFFLQTTNQDDKYESYKHQFN